MFWADSPWGSRRRGDVAREHGVPVVMATSRRRRNRRPPPDPALDTADTRVMYGFMGHSSHPDRETVDGSDFCRSSWPGWRGRAREWELVVGLLQATKVGRGGVLLVEGRSGVGKSRLLGITATAAAKAGLAVAQGTADELTQLIPLAPLTSALGQSGRALPADDRLTVCGPADQRLLLVERLQGPLEQRVAQGPMLLTLDDLHWADPITLLALRSMTRDLASYPLVWMLSAPAAAATTPASTVCSTCWNVTARAGSRWRRWTSEQ